MMAMKPKMHDPSKVKCPHVTLFEQLERLLSTKQEEEEPSIEHTKRFKQGQDNVKSIVEKNGCTSLSRMQKNTSTKHKMTSRTNAKKTAMSHLWHTHF